MAVFHCDPAKACEYPIIIDNTRTYFIAWRAKKNGKVKCGTLYRSNIGEESKKEFIRNVYDIHESNCGSKPVIIDISNRKGPMSFKEIKKVMRNRK